MWIRVGGVKSGRLINFIVLPLGSAMVIDPMDLMCNHHLTPTRGGMETVNRNLNGAKISRNFSRQGYASDLQPRQSFLTNHNSLRLAGSPAAAWKPVSLKTIMRPSTC